MEPNDEPMDGEEADRKMAEFMNSLFRPNPDQTNTDTSQPSIGLPPKSSNRKKKSDDNPQNSTPQEWQPYKYRPSRSDIDRYKAASTQPEPATCGVCGESVAYSPFDRDVKIVPDDLGVADWEMKEKREAEENGESYWMRDRCECDNKRWRAYDAMIAEQKRLIRLDKAEKALRKSGITLQQSESWTFETFDPLRHPSVHHAFVMLSKWAKDFEPGKNKKGYVIQSSDYGVGKTHLAVATAQEIIKNGHSVCFSSMVNILKAIRQEFSGRSEEIGTMMQFAVSCDVLAIDDLGAERIAEGEKGDWTREQLFSIFDDRFGKPIIVTTNLRPDEIAKQIGGTHGGRIVSRLSAMTDWLSITGPDSRQL